MNKILKLQPIYPSALSLNFATMGNGTMPSGFIGSTWSILSGKAVNNPTLGATELITNGGFDSGTTGWTSGNGTILSVAGGQAGNCCELTRTGGATQELLQVITVSLSAWYRLSGYVKSGTSGNESNNLTFQQNLSPYTNEYSSNITSSGSWVNYVISGRPTAQTSMRLNFRKNTATDGTMLFDTASMKTITVSSLFSSHVFSSSYGTIKAAWTRSLGCPFGSVICLDNPYNPLNFVIVYHNFATGTLKMDKCVNGVYTNLISVAVTYGAGKNVMIRRPNGSNTFQAWYGTAGAEVQVGTDQTITDSGIIGNKYHGLFDTSPKLNTCSSFSYSAV